MLAAVHPITIEQGSTFMKEIQLSNKDNQPLDLTGYTGSGEIKTNSKGVLVATIEVIIDNPTSGKFKLRISDEDTSLIPVTGDSYSKKDKYTYDVILTPPSGETFRLLNGTAFVSPGVTGIE